MKKLLVLLLLSTSLPTFADSHLDFTLSDFCYQQPNIQERFEDGFLPLDRTFEDYDHMFSQGTYYFPNEVLGITATSICVYKDAYGQHESKGNLKNGRKNGTWTFWRSDGAKEIEFNFKNGKQDGKYITWDPNGNKSTEIDYKDDRIHGKHYSWWGNGKKMMIFSYKNGKRDGNQYMWHKNGQKSLEINWKDGILDGIATTWNEKGEITSEKIMKDGECISGDCPS